MCSLTNNTAATWVRTSMELTDGAWTVEPPGLVLPNEADVPFGSQSRGIISLVQGTLELFTTTGESDGLGATIWVQWTNGGRGKISCDAAAPAGFEVAVTASDSDNNRVTIQISRGAGTARGSGAQASPAAPTRAMPDSDASSAPVASSTVLVKEGWLGKQGDGGLFSSSTDFKRRWCRCSETRLEILVDHGGRRKGVIDFRRVSAVRRGADSAQVVEMVAQESGGWQVHTFQAEDELTREEWFVVLTEQVASLKLL